MGKVQSTTPTATGTRSTTSRKPSAELAVATRLNRGSRSKNSDKRREHERIAVAERQIYRFFRLSHVVVTMPFWAILPGWVGSLAATIRPIHNKFE